MNNSAANIRSFELALLFLLVFVAVYFVYLAVRDFKMSKDIRLLNWKVRDLIAGNYSDSILIQGDADLVELGESLNDLSDVFRMAHDNLEQEKNRLASILTYMTDGVLATDRSGKIVMINETAQQQFNLAYDEALSMNIVDMLGSGSPYSFQDLVSKTPEVVLNRRDENGEFVTLRIRFALNRRESGFISGLVAVSHDATEQEKEERERRLFVSNVSHETNRMMRMISDLLSLSRIDNEVTHLDVEMTNFTAFMTSILNRFDQIRNQKTVTGKVYEIVRDYPLKSIWVEIDTDKMTQVIDNILNNAVKYSPDGGKITVNLRTTKTQMILSISDQGLGIPKKDLPLIFDRFYRVDKARSRQQGGTGLGLSIAKEIVKQHKGFIWAKSEYGKGSTFTIVLPYDKDAVTYEEWEDVED